MKKYFVNKFIFKADLSMIIDAVIIEDDIFYNIIKYTLNKILAE